MPSVLTQYADNRLEMVQNVRELSCVEKYSEQIWRSTGMSVERANDKRVTASRQVTRSNLYATGGDDRIRTCDGLLTHNGLANRRLKPLGHISSGTHILSSSRLLSRHEA